MQHNNIKLLVATPTKDNRVHTDYFHAMLALERGAKNAGIEIEFMTLAGQVTKKAMNTMASYFYLNKDFSHCFFLDSDIGIPIDCIPRLMRKQVDLVGVPACLKGFNNGKPVLNLGEIYSIDDTGLAEVEHVGNAVWLMNRKTINVLVKISQEYPEDPKHSKGNVSLAKCWDIFHVGVCDDGIYRPQDYSTCYRLKQAGFKIHADLTIPIRHYGEWGFNTTEELLNELRGDNK